MLLQASQGRSGSAHVVVLGNEKGGSGKSTTALHIAVALLKAGQRVATIDLDCRFTGQVRAGKLVAEGRVVSAGRSIFFARTEVFDAEGRMVAFGASTHRWRSGSEKVEGVPADAAG